MSNDLDLTAAVQAAAEVAARVYRGRLWHALGPIEQYYVRLRVMPLIVDASPHIAAQVAEHVALAIERECPHEDEHPEGCCEVCDFASAAAEIAREGGGGR